MSERSTRIVPVLEIPPPPSPPSFLTTATRLSVRSPAEETPPPANCALPRVSLRSDSTILVSLKALEEPVDLVAVDHGPVHARAVDLDGGRERHVEVARRIGVFADPCRRVGLGLETNTVGVVGEVCLVDRRAERAVALRRLAFPVADVRVVGVLGRVRLGTVAPVAAGARTNPTKMAMTPPQIVPIDISSILSPNPASAFG